MLFSCSVMSDSFATLWTGACQASLSMGFSGHDYCSGLPFPSSGDLPDPGMECASLMSPGLAHSFSFKEQASFNFMASITICSDFGAQEKSVTVSIVFPSICYEVMGLDAMIFVFLNVEF